MRDQLYANKRKKIDPMKDQITNAYKKESKYTQRKEKKKKNKTNE